MSAINSIAELTPAKGKQQPAYSPLEHFWTRFLEWRKRKRLHTQLCDLSDKELADIGITRGELDHVASHRDIDPRYDLSSC